MSSPLQTGATDVEPVVTQDATVPRRRRQRVKRPDLLGQTFHPILPSTPNYDAFTKAALCLQAELFNTCNRMQIIDEERWLEAQATQSRLEAAESRCQDLTQQLTNGISLCENYKNRCNQLEGEVSQLKDFVQLFQWGQWQGGLVPQINES